MDDPSKSNSSALYVRVSSLGQDLNGRPESAPPSSSIAASRPSSSSVNEGDTDV